MKTVLEKVEDGKVELTVEIPEQDFEKDLKAAYKRVASQVRIPGFRRGHIPRQILDQRVGKEAVLDEMAQEAVPRFYREAIRQEKIDPIGFPEIKLEQLHVGSALIFKAVIPVAPTPTLGDYKGLEIQIPEPVATDDDVAERLGILQDRFAELKVKETEAATGDQVLCDYKVKSGDEEIESLAVSDYMIKVGSNDVAKEFSEAMAGAGLKSTVSFNMTLPADHPNKKVAGREVEIELTVKEIKEEIKPEINDDFAKQVSEFDTLDELKADIKSKLQKRREEESEKELRSQAVNSAIKNAILTVPESMVDAEVDSMINRFVAPMRRQGEDVDKYLTESGITRDMLKQQFESSAKRRVEQEIILAAIADAEGISITDDEIDAEITKIAEEEGNDPKKLRNELEKLDRIFEVGESLRLRKALDLLVSEAKPVHVSADEYKNMVSESFGGLAESPVEGEREEN